MASIQQLEQWREQYGYVYQMRIANDMYIFRALTLSEIELINRHFKKEHNVEEVICQVAVIYPEELNFSTEVKAGTPNRLSRAILEHSHILNADQPLEILDEYREKMNQLQYQAEATILSAFPQIRLEEIKNWSVERLMEWLARAEWALQEIHGLPVGFINPVDNELDEDMEELEDEEYEDENEFAEQGHTDEEELLSPIQRLARDLRAQGKDPMMELGPLILKKPTANFVPIPMIGGTRAWRKDEVLDRVREQLQYVIRKR